MPFYLVGGCIGSAGSSGSCGLGGGGAGGVGGVGGACAFTLLALWPGWFTDCAAVCGAGNSCLLHEANASNISTEKLMIDRFIS